MSQLLENKISPFEFHYRDVGVVTSNFCEAIHLLPVTYTQSPHWQQKPTQEQLDMEAQWLQEADDAATKIKEIAADIYLALTGEKVPEPEKHIPFGDHPDHLRSSHE